LKHSNKAAAVLAKQAVSSFSSPNNDEIWGSNSEYRAALSSSEVSKKSVSDMFNA
jgi:hypothetical protein